MSTEANKKKTAPKRLLSVSILVSNRIDTIETCLESIQPLLKAIPSELIVVDTVGEANSDGSLAIAKRYADRVVHFDWCDDFSAARNAGLALASGEWFLYLDDDEWFDDVTELIDFFRTGEYKQYKRAVHSVHNYSDAMRTAYTVSQAVGMTVLRPDTRFVNSIHELLSPALEPVRYFSAFVHHTGYFYATPEEKQAHTQRNRHLLEKAMKKNPDDLWMLIHLVNEMDPDTEMEALERQARRGLALAHGKPMGGLQTETFFRAKLVMSCLQQGNIEKAIALCDEFLKETLPELCAVWIFYAMAHAQDKLGNAPQALHFAHLYFEQAEMLEKNPDIMRNQSCMWLNSFGGCDTKNEVCAMAIRAAAKLEKYGVVLEYFARYTWKNGVEGNPLLPHLVYAVCICETGLEQLARAVPEGVQNELPSEILSWIGLAKEAYPAHACAFTRMLAGWEKETPYLLLQRALVLQQDGNQEVLAVLLEDLELIGITCRPPYEALLPLLVYAGADAHPFIDPTDLEDWEWCIAAWAKMPWEEQRPLLEYAQNNLLAYSRWRGALLCARLYGQRLSATLSDPDFVVTLRTCVESFLSFAHEVYAAEMFQEENKLILPCEVRFALCMERAYVAQAAGDTKEYLATLKEAVRTCPDQKQAVSRLLAQLETQMEPKPAAQGEFLQLAAQVKQQARGLLDAGHPEQAEPILRQLLQLLPEDAEAKELLARL